VINLILDYLHEGDLTWRNLEWAVRAECEEYGIRFTKVQFYMCMWALIRTGKVSRMADTDRSGRHYYESILNTH
jgi:hypothetical protein